MCHLEITENLDVVEAVSQSDTKLDNRAIILTVAYHATLLGLLLPQVDFPPRPVRGVYMLEELEWPWEE